MIETSNKAEKLLSSHLKAIRNVFEGVCGELETKNIPISLVSVTIIKARLKPTKGIEFSRLKPFNNMFDVLSKVLISAAKKGGVEYVTFAFYDECCEVMLKAFKEGLEGN